MANRRPSCREARCAEVAHFRLVLLRILLLAGLAPLGFLAVLVRLRRLLNVRQHFGVGLRGRAPPLTGPARPGGAGTREAVLPGMLYPAIVAADKAAAVAATSLAAWKTLPLYRNGFFRRHTVAARMGGLLFRKLCDTSYDSTIWILCCSSTLCVPSDSSGPTVELQLDVMSTLQRATSEFRALLKRTM